MNILWVVVPVVLLAIGVLSLSIACYKADKRLKSLEHDVKVLMEKQK